MCLLSSRSSDAELAVQFLLTMRQTFRWFGCPTQWVLQRRDLGRRLICICLAGLFCLFCACRTHSTSIATAADSRQKGDPALAQQGPVSEMSSFWSRRGTIDAVTIDPQGRWVVAAGRDANTAAYDDHGDVKLYATSTGEVVTEITVARRVGYLAVSHDGSMLALGTEPNVRRPTEEGREVMFYHVGEDGACTEVTKGSIDFQPNVSFTFVGHRFVAAGDGRMAVWKTRDWTVERSTVSGLQGLAGSKGSSCIAVAAVLGARGVVRVWDLRNSNEISELPGRTPLAFLLQGDLMAYRVPDSASIGLWDTLKQQPRGLLPESDASWVRFSASTTGRHLAALDNAGAIKVWNVGVADSTLVGRLSVPRACDLAFTDREDVLAVAIGWSETELEHRPDGSVWAVGRAEEPAAELWLVTEEKLGFHLQTRNDRMAVDGTTVVTYTVGGEQLEVWDVAQPEKPEILWKDRWRARPWCFLE